MIQAEPAFHTGATEPSIPEWNEMALTDDFESSVVNYRHAVKSLVRADTVDANGNDDERE